ncbi:hypothetical protein R4Z09_22070 [Niallia oryzisoli]|uniref:Uncharacterized protein n=1 Tax=Niallia oryzisoli TaxID=1737571 RepID=A0ABZ2C8K1_9BACI
MSKQQSDKQGNMINTQPGAGSKYHEEHAGNVQGYGSNNVDVNESGMTNSKNNDNQ